MSIKKSVDQHLLTTHCSLYCQHCQYWNGQIVQQIPLGLLAGDLVCSHVKWNNSKYRQLKVEVTSQAECKGSPRSERRLTAHPIIDDLCCVKSDDQWTGFPCKRDSVIG